MKDLVIRIDDKFTDIQRKDIAIAIRAYAKLNYIRFKSCKFNKDEKRITITEISDEAQKNIAGFVEQQMGCELQYHEKFSKYWLSPLPDKKPTLKKCAQYLQNLQKQQDQYYEFLLYKHNYDIQALDGSVKVICTPHELEHFKKFGVHNEKTNYVARTDKTFAQPALKVLTAESIDNTEGLVLFQEVDGEKVYVSKSLERAAQNAQKRIDTDPKKEQKIAKTLKEKAEREQKRLDEEEEGRSTPPLHSEEQDRLNEQNQAQQGLMESIIFIPESDSKSNTQPAKQQDSSETPAYEEDLSAAIIVRSERYGGPEAHSETQEEKINNQLLEQRQENILSKLSDLEKRLEEEEQNLEEKEKALKQIETWRKSREDTQRLDTIKEKEKEKEKEKTERQEAQRLAKEEAQQLAREQGEKDKVDKGLEEYAAKVMVAIIKQDEEETVIDKETPEERQERLNKIIEERRIKEEEKRKSEEREAKQKAWNAAEQCLFYRVAGIPSNNIGIIKSFGITGIITNKDELMVVLDAVKKSAPYNEESKKLVAGIEGFYADYKVFQETGGGLTVEQLRGVAEQLGGLEAMTNPAMGGGGLGAIAMAQVRQKHPKPQMSEDERQKKLGNLIDFFEEIARKEEANATPEVRERAPELQRLAEEERQRLAAEEAQRRQAEAQKAANNNPGNGQPFGQQPAAVGWEPDAEKEAKSSLFSFKNIALGTAAIAALGATCVGISYYTAGKPEFVKSIADFCKGLFNKAIEAKDSFLQR